jgi:hypothetical protein
MNSTPFPTLPASSALPTKRESLLSSIDWPWTLAFVPLILLALNIALRLDPQLQALSDVCNTGDNSACLLGP